MLGLPALIAGLILDFAGQHWFPGAHTVGIILTIVGGLFTVIPLCVILVAFVATMGRRF